MDGCTWILFYTQRADAVDEEEEEDGEEEELGSGPTPLVAAQAAADDEEEDDEAGGLLDDEGEDDYAVEGQILSSKGRGADDGDDAGVFKLEGAAKGGKRGRGGSKKPRPLRFRSAVRAWQGVAAPLLPPGEGEEEGVKKDDADDATALSPGLTARLAEEVQRLALPALCLMPLERSTFVLFSPKLLLPDPAFHHFVLPVARRAVDARLRPTSNTTTTTPSCPFPKSPRVAVVSPRGEALEAPDLVADDHVLLYGCTLVEWAPAGDEALLPRCLTLVSTEPRFESLRGALLAMRGAQAAVMPMTPQGSSPLTPGTPKKTPWQLEDEKQQRARKAEAGAGAGVEAPSMALLEAAVLDERRSHAGRPASAEAARYWRRAAQGYGHAAVAAFTLGGTGVGGGAGGGGGGGFGGNALLFPTAGAGAASLPLTMTGGGGGGAPAVAAATGMGNSDNNASSSSSTPRLPPPLLRALPAPVDASYVPLFRALSPETLLQALTAVLLERPVVVQSSSRTLAALACEALRRLVHPFAWLRPYMPLLPVAGVCAFWDEVKRSGGGQTWYDYVFEDDGLDDSLAPATGEAYVVRTRLCLCVCIDPPIPLHPHATQTPPDRLTHTPTIHNNTTGARHHLRRRAAPRPGLPRRARELHRRRGALRPPRPLPRVQRHRLPRLGLRGHLRGPFV